MNGFGIYCYLKCWMCLRVDEMLDVIEDFFDYTVGFDFMFDGGLYDVIG